MQHFTDLIFFCKKMFLQRNWVFGKKIKYLNLNIFRTRCCNPLIFQNQIISTKRIHSLKYLRSAKFGSIYKVIRKSEFVAKTQYFGVFFSGPIYFFRSYILFPVLYTFCESCKNNRLFLQFSKFPNFKNYRLQNLNLFFILSCY